MIPIPADVVIALVFMGAVSAAMVCAGVFVARRWGLLWSTLMALAAVGVLVAHGVYLVDNVVMAKVLPVANLIVYGNLAGPAAGFLAGTAWVRMSGPAWNRAVLVVPLLGVGVWRMVEPFTGEKPVTGSEKWTLGVMRQSTQATCSAAAAVTLLRHHDIPSSEAEMSDLCLTRTFGTTMLGLYRGLKIKTRATPYDVRVFRGTMKELAREPLPAVVSVGAQGLPQGPPVGSGLGLRLPEGRHSIVIFRFVNGEYVEVGDPYVGRQLWTVGQLGEVWRGEAVMLVKR